jgi:regulator of PEP synthase PpsR (kinase-PPPase family)
MQTTTVEIDAMGEAISRTQAAPAAPIFVISGGAGASGVQLVRTALAQFPAADVPVIVVPHVRQVEQLETIVARAAAAAGAIVHTLVDADVRRALVDLAQAQQVPAIDLMGPLLDHLTAALEQPPLGQAGRYRTLNADYFQRIEAIEFTVAHDDGRNPDEWGLAEIVLVGVSRVGKTPLSIYLAVLGWKVANVPLVRELPPPLELFQIDPRRAIGLTIAPDRLLAHRQHRQHRLGLLRTPYANPVALSEELDAALHLFRQRGIPIVNVTDKPLEAIADEVIAILLRRRDRANSSENAPLG